MLFIQSNTRAVSLAEGERLRLLDALAASGRTPLLRSARRSLFRTLVGAGGGETEAAAAELERACAVRGGAEGAGAYAPGDLFCDGDCVLALVFGEGDAGGSLTASVVYDLDTAEPLARLSVTAASESGDGRSKSACPDLRQLTRSSRSNSPASSILSTETAPCAPASASSRRGV